jgi:pimeloyl-ACP methyl ester carboxylesterase
MATALALGVPLSGCRSERDLAERAEMPDTMVVHHAMEDATARDGVLDTMPGGEMARGRQTAEMRLLGDKMPEGDTSGGITTSVVAGPAGTLSVRVAGAGDLPVVFVHSGAGTARHWDAQMRHFGATRRAVALDLRAHGQSAPADDGAYSVDSFAADVAAVADSLALERFILVGQSLGSAVALAYAAAHPDRVAGLVLIDAAGDLRGAPPEEIRAWLDGFGPETYREASEAHWENVLEGARPEVREEVLRDLRRTPRLAVVGALESVVSFDPVGALRRYAGLTIAIVTPHADGPEGLQSQVEGLRVVRIPGLSHWPQMDRPDDVNAVIGDMIEDVSEK